MAHQKNQQEKKGNNWILIFLILDLIILFLSFIIFLNLITLNQDASCLHHIEEFGGTSWILGRTLGFTTLIWFIYTAIKGAKTKKIGKLFSSYQKAKNYHCLSATITISINLLHYFALLTSDPWGPLIFSGESNHMPFILFVTKFWTGVIFGIFMIISTVLFFYLRDVKRLRKFGYKRFIKVHHIMLLATIVLAVHIFLINIEILIIFWG